MKMSNHHVIVFLLLLRAVLFQASPSATVSVQLSNPVHRVDEDFLSVTIDAGSISRNWSDIDFTSTKVINMAKALYPAMLRIGGTSQDYLLFKPDLGEFRSNFTMTTSQWDAVNTFVKAVKWKLIFGLNQLLHNSEGNWDSGNAKELIMYTLNMNYPVAWELGNEPDLYSRSVSSPPTPQQVANGFHELRVLLTDLNYPITYIAGPDVASPRSYLHDFLVAIKSHKFLINATTWHHYYESSATAKLSDFYSVDVLDRLFGTVEELIEIVRSVSYEGDLWLGETSSTYGGGTSSYSQCYISGFMWLDKLGITAYTQKKIFRQDFVGGNYALLNSDQNPLPDFWLSVLYKQLVGSQVLSVKGALEKGRSIRIYAHCAKMPYSKGSVVLLALNTNKETATVTLADSELIGSQRDVYWLTATNITSQSVSLNGALLQLNGDELPKLQPVNQPSGPTLHFSPLSFGYIVFKTANAKACMSV